MWNIISNAPYLLVLAGMIGRYRARQERLKIHNEIKQLITDDCQRIRDLILEQQRQSEAAAAACVALDNIFNPRSMRTTTGQANEQGWTPRFLRRFGVAM
ncbi:hypothetical protein EJB05_30065 [Eragrostis curvula]|uniref:Uncharacterized protein n=1 Tax=Eragrostis curvula TaxID=38414 RepID=A0A5J9UVR3_9POAL|nr:hypothetical protein EJB05_30065 [Eragrostis curvula]